MQLNRVRPVIIALAYSPKSVPEDAEDGILICLVFTFPFF